MPDITMCRGNSCELKESCYRFLAIPAEPIQSWFIKAPYNQQTKTCDFYWELQNPVGETLKRSAKTVLDIYAARAERNKRLKNKTNES